MCGSFSHKSIRLSLHIIAVGFNSYQSLFALVSVALCISYLSYAESHCAEIEQGVEL